jgi:hypothetical protein
MMPDFTAWQNFNVIVGSSAGALIGLQFVLISLLANRPLRKMSEAQAAFSTPTVVHFSAVLLLSCFASVPWKTVNPISTAWGAVSVLGLIYNWRVVHQMKSQDVYAPVVEDWVFHSISPILSYALVAVGAVLAHYSLSRALFFVSAAMLILLFTGIHNSWDAVTYSVLRHAEERHDKVN